MTSGGKRKGAGRPPLSPEDVPEPLTIKAHPSAVARFKAWCAAKGLSQREAFEQWARRLKPNAADDAQPKAVASGRLFEEPAGKSTNKNNPHKSAE